MRGIGSTSDDPGGSWAPEPWIGAVADPLRRSRGPMMVFGLAV